MTARYMVRNLRKYMCCHCGSGAVFFVVSFTQEVYHSDVFQKACICDLRRRADFDILDHVKPRIC